MAVDDDDYCKRIFILRKSTRNYRRVVNLMLITGKNSFPDEPGKHSRKHYIAIKLLSRLLTVKNSKHKEAQYHCTNCLHGFPTEVSRDKHESSCVANDAVRIEIPSWNPYVRYSKGKYQLKVPFTMYADLESLLVKPSKEEKERGIVNVDEPSG